MNAQIKSAKANERTTGSFIDGYAVIGNGLMASTRRRMSLLEEYRAKQAACTHAKRDPRGMCYDCGHREGHHAA